MRIATWNVNSIRARLPRVVPWLADELTRRLVEVAPRSQVQILPDEPAVGAVWLALAEARGEARVPRYADPRL